MSDERTFRQRLRQQVVEAGRRFVFFVLAAAMVFAVMSLMLSISKGAFQ